MTSAFAVLTRSKWFWLLLLLVICIVSWQFTAVRYGLYQLWFEATRDNPIIEEKESVIAVLADLETLSLSELPEEYLRLSGSDQPPFRSRLTGRRFYKVPKGVLPKRVVGTIRFNHLVSRDRWYRRVILGKEEFIPLLIDQRILFKLIELQAALKEEGHDPNAFRLNGGHRNPVHNTKVGGAARSRHIFGDALDLKIGDINQDNTVNEADKAIVLNLLDQQIIRSEGGIGRYPGTMVIHMDVRGYHARWDSY